MAIPKIDGAINDFSAGELDPDIKRSESPLIKMGGRQMANWRTLNSHKKANRPGRSALFIASGRVEEIPMPGGAVFFLNFGAHVLKVFNSAGSQVFTSSVKGDGSTSIPWTANTLGGITYTIIGLAIYIAYPDGAPNNVPQILTFDGVSTWTLSTYAEMIEATSQKRTAFFRISPQSVTMQPSATTGVVTLSFSQNILVSGMIGTRMRFANRQIQIKTVSSGTSGTATVIEPLPPSQTLTLTSQLGQFNIGDDVLGSVTGAQGIVTSGPNTQQLNTGGNAPEAQIGDTLTGSTSGATGVVINVINTDFGTAYIVQLSTGTAFVASETVTGGTVNTGTFTLFSSIGSTSMVVQILPSPTGDAIQFSTSDKVAGPSGSASISAVSTGAPQPVSLWDDEVMNFFRGFPSSIFSDQSRLGLCNIPSVPSGIIWSAVSLPLDLYTGAQPDDSIFELAPDQSQVLYIVPGMESSEFVFTDRAIHYIPINATIPLMPGSVAFNKLSDYGCFAGVQPRRAEQSIVYVKAGGTQIGAVQAPGAYYRPYIVDNISEIHSHLLIGSSPVAIAVPSGPTQFEELYIYLALANGAAMVGRYTMRNGLIEPGPEGKPTIGWMPWNGGGTIGWVHARQGDVIFTSTYAPNGITPVTIVEKLDATRYLDAAIFVNNVPAALTPPGGKGPLWWLANGTVTLIDLGTRFMGTYSIDANGNLIPQFIGSENLLSPQLVAGQPWTAVFEPFIPHALPGQDNQQRMRRRRVAKALVHVQNSTGFVFGTRRVPAYFVGDDATQAAPLREDSYQIRPLGRSYDPRLVLTKDTPGPLTVVEYGFEVTV